VNSTRGALFCACSEVSQKCPEPAWRW
jgi:hypothetical protein